MEQNDVFVSSRGKSAGRLLAGYLMVTALFWMNVPARAQTTGSTVSLTAKTPAFAPSSALPPLVDVSTSTTGTGTLDEDEFPDDLMTFTRRENPEVATSEIISLDERSTTDTEDFTQEFRSTLDGLEKGEAGDLSLSEVTRIAMSANPNWATYVASHQAAHAELIRACAFPNPEIEVEAGRERARGRDESGRRPSANTWSLGFAQPIEMPGKRLARQIEAEAGFAVVAGEEREFETSLRGDVAEAYWTVQYQASLERLHGSLLDVALRLEEIARDRFQLGDAGRAEVLNAKVEVLRARRDRDVAKRRKQGARAALNALTGGRLATGRKLSDPLPTPSRPYGLEQAVRQALSCHPRLVRLAAELERRYATIDRERTSWWPDLKLGVRQSREFDTNATAATLGVELPLWNRNQGGIAQAGAQAQRTHADIAIAFNEIRRDVESAWQSFEAAREQVSVYRMPEGLRSAAEEAVAVAWLEYKVGVSGYLDVLSARRLLQETEQGYLQALFDSATARARLDRAIGTREESRSPAVPVAPRKPNRRN